MQLSLSFLDQTVIEEVPLDLWRELFEAVGWPDSLQNKRDTFLPQDVRHALERDVLSEELLLALEVIHSLGTEAGRDAIATAMADQHVPAETLPANMGERELALRLYLGQRSDASLADVLVRAQTQVEERSDHRRYNEFLGSEARPISALPSKCERLRADVLAYCQAKDLGNHVHVHAFEDDGTFVFQVIRSHSTVKPRAVLEGQPGRTTIEYRPVHADILRYESGIGRLRIAARVASVVDYYRLTLGRILFNDEDFFNADAICGLRAVQEGGQEALDGHGLPLIGRVRMTECLWQRGDQVVLHIRSTDCLKAIEELGLSLTEGYLIQARLKLHVIGPSTRPLIVNIRAPSRIEVSQKRHEQLADQYLDAVGIRGARTEPVGDLWSLHPWRHPISVWRGVFGGETDSLVRNGVLVPTQLGSAASADHPGAGNVLEAHPVSAGSLYGVSGAPEIASRSLTPTDLDGLELRPEQLRLYLRSHYKIVTDAAHWGGTDETLDLGEIEIGETKVRLAYALRQPTAGFGDRLRARSGGVHSALLVPAARNSVPEFAFAVLAAPFSSRGRMIRNIVRACGLAGVVPAPYSAPEGVRLVVDSTKGQIWIDEVEVSAIRPDTHPFRFIEAMARSSSESMTAERLTEMLSAARKDTDGTVTARQAKFKALKAINEALTNAGKPLADDPFPAAGTGCYRCTLPSHVI